MGRGGSGRRGGSGSGGKYSGYQPGSGRFRLGSSGGSGTTNQNDSSDMPVEEFLRQFLSEDKVCEKLFNVFNNCFQSHGDSCVADRYIRPIATCPEKYQEAFVEHLQLERLDEGCDKVQVHFGSLEERCSRISRNYERMVDYQRKDDGSVRMFKKILAKCPDKFQEVFSRN